MPKYYLKNTIFMFKLRTVRTHFRERELVVIIRTSRDIKNHFIKRAY